MRSIKSNPFLIPFLILILWLIFYFSLDRITSIIVFSIFNLPKGTHLTDTIYFFIYEVPKVLLLLILIVFLVGIVRSYFSPEKTRKALEGKSLFAGNVLASGLGIVTPFCSCSAIPLFLGFVEAGIPLGVTFSFLIAAPMINEVALVLLFSMFGYKTALIYLVTGLFIAISAGWVIGRMKLEKYVQEWVFDIKVGAQTEETGLLKLKQRINAGYSAVDEIVRKVWLYIVIGIAVGAAAHGYVPQNFMVSLLGGNNWYSVPLAVLIGIPLYSNAAGIIPIISVLIEKGASLGSALAFMMSVIALSLPEIIILKKVLKMPLIFIFISVVGIGIMIVGFIFNAIFSA